MRTIAHHNAYFSHDLLHNDINLSSICLKVNGRNNENAAPLWNADGTPPIRQAMLRGWKFPKRMGNPGIQKFSRYRLQVRLLKISIVPATRGFFSIRNIFYRQKSCGGKVVRRGEDMT